MNYNSFKPSWNNDYRSYNKKYVSMKKVGLFKKIPDSYNRILTDKIQLSLNGRQTRKNNHVFIASDSFGYAAHHYIIPNILQTNSNYIVMDPGGYLYKQTHSFLESEGYRIQVFNISNPSLSSVRYNPFENLVKVNRGSRGDSCKHSVEMMIDTIIASTSSLFDNNFFGTCNHKVQEAERHLLIATALYMLEQGAATIGFASMIHMLDWLLEEADAEKQGTGLSDAVFRDLAETNPKSEALIEWEIYKELAKKDSYAILIAANIRMQLFKIETIQELTCDNTLDMKALTEPNQALFIILPEIDTTFDLIAAILIQQLVDNMYEFAEQTPPNVSLPQPLTIFLNDQRFMSVPDLSRKIVTSRKYNIGFNIISKSLKNLQNKYPQEWEIIIDNCDSILYFHSEEQKMREFISQRTGILTPEEVESLSQDKCILLIRGLNPFCSNVYNLSNHPKYLKYANS